MEEEELIKKLENIKLPKIEVESHRRRLRMALLDSKYFKKQVEGGVFSLAKSKIKGGIEMMQKGLISRPSVWKPAVIGVVVAAVIFGISFIILMPFGGGPMPAKRGEVVFAITDAAADMGAVSSVNVTIDSIEVHGEDGAWTTLSTNAGTYDLLELKAEGITKLLVETDLEIGTYDQVRLNISKVIVVDSNGSHEAKLPSNKLQLKRSFEINSDTVTAITFDFVADQSLHITGEGRYIFAPVIQLETRNNAEVHTNVDNEVQISGGQVVDHARVGMDAKGNMDTGLLISPDAVLTINASDRVIQAKGQALVTGVIKEVDTTTGTVTITTKGGTDVVLRLASSGLADLENKINNTARIQYNVETRGVTNADIGAEAESNTSLIFGGTLKAVDIPAGTITITCDSGADITLSVAAEVSLASLATKVGSQVTVRYNTETGEVININIEGESQAKINVSGTLKAVNLAEGTITITTSEGDDIILSISSSTEIRLGGAISRPLSLVTHIGSELEVEYNADTNTAISINIEGKSQGGVVSSVLLH